MHFLKKLPRCWHFLVKLVGVCVYIHNLFWVKAFIVQGPYTLFWVLREVFIFSVPCIVWLIAVRWWERRRKMAFTDGVIGESSLLPGDNQGQFPSRTPSFTEVSSSLHGVTRSGHTKLPLHFKSETWALIAILKTFSFRLRPEFLI